MNIGGSIRLNPCGLLTLGLFALFLMYYSFGWATNKNSHAESISIKSLLAASIGKKYFSFLKTFVKLIYLISRVFCAISRNFFMVHGLYFRCCKEGWIGSKTYSRTSKHLVINLTLSVQKKTSCSLVIVYILQDIFKFRPRGLKGDPIQTKTGKYLPMYNI